MDIIANRDFRAIQFRLNHSPLIIENSELVHKEDVIHEIDGDELFEDVSFYETSNYALDNYEYKFLPLNKRCKKFSIDLKFICFPKDVIRNFEQLFSKQQILINKFICSSYVRAFKFENGKDNICELGKNIAKGINKQEVVSIPKTIKKSGFFEKLFHFFR